MLSMLCLYCAVCVVGLPCDVRLFRVEIMGLGLGPAWQINDENLGFGRIAMQTYARDRKAKSVKATGTGPSNQSGVRVNESRGRTFRLHSRFFYLGVRQRSSRAL